MPTTTYYAFTADYSSIATCLFAIQGDQDAGAYNADPKALALIGSLGSDLLPKLYSRVIHVLATINHVTPESILNAKGDFDKLDFQPSDFSEGYTDATNQGYSSLLQTILNLLADLTVRQNEISDADKQRLDAALIPVLDGFDALQVYLEGAGINPCSSTANAYLNNSPSLWLQVGGADGSDGIPAGFHLRWSLAGELGENHFPRGSYSDGETIQNGYNRSNDYVHVYRTAYDSNLRFSLDLESATPVINHLARQWTYVAGHPNGSAIVNDRIRLTFPESELYNSLATAQDPQAAPSTFLKQYPGTVIAEVVNKTFFSVSYDYHKKLATDPAQSILKLQAMAVTDTVNTENTPFTIRQTIRVTDQAAQSDTIYGDNLYAVQFKKSANGFLKSLSFETYDDFLISRVDSAWTEIGNGFALSTNDQAVSDRLETSAYPIDNKWPQYTGGSKVRADNYRDKWQTSRLNEPSVKSVVNTYLELSETDPKAEDVLQEEGADPSSPGLLISYLDVLHLMALDYHLARMLGVGFIDTPAGVSDTATYVYRITYTTRKSLATGQTVNLHYMSLPVSKSNKLQPLQPLIRPVGYALPSADEVPNNMVDEQGYSKLIESRVINIGRQLFKDEITGYDFFDDLTTIDNSNQFLNPKPVLYGIEYRPAGASTYIKPEITITSAVADQDSGHSYNNYNSNNPAGYLETVPVPDNQDSLFIHFEKQEGVHFYAIYGISLLGRASAISSEVSTDATAFPARNQLQPPNDYAVQYIQREESLLFTTQTEQNWLAGRKQQFPQLDTSFTRLTFNWLNIKDISYLQDTSDLTAALASRADRIKLLFKDSAPLEVIGLIINLIPVAGDESLLQLFTDGNQLLNGTVVQPTIAAADYARFTGSLLNTKTGQFVVKGISAGASGPVITISRGVHLTNADGPLGTKSFGARPVYSSPEINSRFSMVENLGNVENWLGLTESIQLVDPGSPDTPEVETSTDSEGNVTTMLVGGIHGDAIVSPVLPGNVNEPALPGYYQISFATGTHLNAHPQVNLPFDPDHPAANTPATLQGPHVVWDKGLLRMPLQADPTQKKAIQVIKIQQTTPLVLYAYDASFQESPIAVSATGTAQIAGVNYHPGYRAYLFSEPAPAKFNRNSILPPAGEDSRKILISLQAHNSTSGNLSATSVPTVMLTRTVADPEILNPPAIQNGKVRPDATGKAALTFDVRMDPDENNLIRNPFAFMFYRANEEEVLHALYEPATVTAITSALSALTLDEHYDQRYSELVNVSFDPDHDGQFRVFEATPANYGFPQPDKTGLTASGDSTNIKRLKYMAAIQSTLLPLTEQPVINAFIKTGTQTENKLPVLRTIDGSLLSSTDPLFDPFPMVRKYFPAGVTNSYYIRFTDYNLSATSRKLYFFGGAEVTNELIPGPLSQLTGPVRVLATQPAPAPIIRSFKIGLTSTGNSPISVTFLLSAFSPADNINKVRVYRSLDSNDAKTLRTMDSFFEMPLTAEMLTGPEITDDFSDLAQVPLGETMYYRLAGVRTINNEKDQDEDILSVGSEVITVTLIDIVNPPAPQLTYTASPAQLSWPVTVNKGTYYLYQQNSRGNWQKIFTSTPAPGTTVVHYGLAAALDLTDDNGNRIYYRYKVRVENGSGLLNLTDKELTI